VNVYIQEFNLLGDSIHCHSSFFPLSSDCCLLCGQYSINLLVSFVLDVQVCWPCECLLCEQNKNKNAPGFGHKGC
jgi:hypothetical protein